MNKYLSKANRDRHFIMLLLWDCMRKWLAEEQNQLEAKEKRKLELAKNHIWEVSEMLLCRLDPEYRNAFAKEIRTHKAEMVRMSRVVEEENVVKMDDLLEIANYSIVACNSLDKTMCMNYKKCKLYKAMMACKIPVCITETDACPYRGESYDKKKKEWKEIWHIDGMERDFKQAVCSNCGQVWTAQTEEQQGTHCPECGGELGEWV